MRRGIPLRHRRRAAGVLTLTLTAALACPIPARAQDPGAGQSAPDTTGPAAPDAAPAPEGAASVLPKMLSGMPGTWDLSRDDSTRRCVITLTTENGPAGRVLRFPAGCRKALPILSGVAGWLYGDGTVRLVDANVRPLLTFASRPDGRGLAATAASGESYSLAPLQIAAMLPKPPEASGTGAAEPRGSDLDGPREILGSQPVLPANRLVPPADAPPPGVYALDRYSQKDVCRLDLSPGADPATLAPVRIVEGCRDAGLTVFDPVSWRFANGLMTLKAKRGHAVNLVPTGDGRWRRDPEIGTTFVLRRVDP